MKKSRLILGLSLLALTVIGAGCPHQHGHHDHPDIVWEWQRVNPEAPHVFEEEQIHFTENSVYYFGHFGGPNTMLPEKHDAHFDLYPAFKGTYVIDESVEPHTIDFTWKHYWPDSHEDESFAPFTQLGIWDALVDRHGSHEHILLYVNFGDGENRPAHWPGEIKFERIDDRHHDHDHHH